jgi:acyl dehydratase
MHDVKVFSGMAGDMNPLHCDEALARTSPFGGLIVQGA